MTIYFSETKGIKSLKKTQFDPFTFMNLSIALEIKIRAENEGIYQQISIGKDMQRFQYDAAWSSSERNEVRKI